MQKEDTASLTKSASKKPASTWQWPWQTSKKPADSIGIEKSRTDAKLQVISSSKIVRRDSSVGSAFRGFQGPNADRSEPQDQKNTMRNIRDVRTQNHLANSRNNSRMSNKAPN